MTTIDEVTLTGEFLSTIRVGQLTGSRDSTIAPPERPRPWPLLVDPQGWPLLNDTGVWGAAGLDLGANTEHSDGRLYFFFGDTATTSHSSNKQNSDMVAWTHQADVLWHGGHLAVGWIFGLPFESTDVQGQPDWRFCGKCHGLFWDGDRNFKGVCSRGGAHAAIGLRYVVPFEPTNLPGQKDWRFCGKCAALFWNGDPAFKGSCPKDGVHVAAGWRFVLPVDPSPVAGQFGWRFCGGCAGLFWDGEANKGLCQGAPGGGFHLRAVLQPDGNFDPFTADPPIGQTLTFEVPNGAFSHSDRVWVFAGIAEEKYSGQPRFGDPAYGCYLVSKERPDLPGLYHKEFLFSPRIGWCPRDERRDLVESHEILGFKFIVSHDIPTGPNAQGDWRLCRRCDSMFWNGGANAGICPRGGGHESAGYNYVLSHDSGEDAQHQGSWRYCRKCAQLFWNGDSARRGLCPAGATHEPAGYDFLLPHASLQEDASHQANWRFCGKCGGLFWDGDTNKGVCAVGASHAAIGFNFVLAHDLPSGNDDQADWRFCGKCAAIFFDGYANDKGVCPAGGSHAAIGYNFVLGHDFPGDFENQPDWRFCGKCSAMFFDGYPTDKGTCPAGGSHAAIGYNFVLSHNPGEDALSEGGWRFCTKCNGLVQSRQEDTFSWVAPVVVQNTNHPGLPQTSHRQGLVMFGFGFSSNPGIRLAWMPLKPAAAPELQDMLYYTGDLYQPWSSEANSAAVILPHTNTYTHLSAAWLEGPQRWILLYSNAYDDLKHRKSFRQPAVARLGATLWNWSDEIKIFKPAREHAYGVYMHEIGRDHIHPDIPPMEDPAKPEHDGWAYGPFLLKRFTEWNATARELGIYYLLSLSSPYQVQLMCTRLRVD